MKSTVEEIRQRFDNEVDRFSNLQTGQSATIDAPLALELVAEAAAVTTPNATRLLDVGCGAGNDALKVLSRLPNLDVTLVDLSGPMLAKAQERIRAVSRGGIRAIQQDMRKSISAIRRSILSWPLPRCIICALTSNGARCSLSFTGRWPPVGRFGFLILSPAPCPACSG